MDRIAKAEGIHLVGVGFPIYDRIGAQRGWKEIMKVVIVLVNRQKSFKI